MYSLKIPESEFDHLSLMLRAKSSVLDSVYEALRRGPPKPRREDLLVYLKEKVEGESSETLGAIARTLSALYWLKASQEIAPAELAKELVNTASQKHADNLPTPSQGWKAFESQLTNLLSLDASMGMAAKATFLAYQGQRHLHSARILTDARPVFADDPTVPPSAFVIIHTLQLEFHEGAEDKEWFIYLDDDDLEALKLTIERAMLKRQSLSHTLHRADAPILEWSIADADAD